MWSGFYSKRVNWKHCGGETGDREQKAGGVTSLNTECCARVSCMCMCVNVSVPAWQAGSEQRHFLSNAEKGNIYIL